MPATSFRYTTRLTVTGEADPQLPARVLAIVTALNRLPLAFHCTLPDPDSCRIEMIVDGGDETFLRRLTSQARKIPTVIEARGSLRGDCENTPNAETGELDKAA